MSTFPPPQGYQTNPVILHEVAFAGAATLDTGELLTKDVLARTELFYEDDTGVQVQLTSGGKINSAAMSLGTANQVIGTNNAATAIEWKSFAVGAGISITHGAGTITVTNTMPGVTAHGGLTGLVAPADDHTQYALLAGRAGGQVVYGGNANGNPLTISATSGTIGQINFCNTGTTATMVLLASGTLLINAAAAIGTEKLYVNGGVNISDTGNLTWAGALKNVRIGNSACAALTTGIRNIAIGEATMSVGVVTGDDNIAMGRLALSKVTTGTLNIAIGYGSLQNGVVTGAGNIAMGYSSLYGLTAGTYNVAIGYSAMGVGVVTGSWNVAIGWSALQSVTSGFENVAIGYAAMGNATVTGTHNYMIGARAGYSLTSGSSNVGLGRDALVNSATCSNNTALGDASMATGVITGNGNTGVGYATLANLTSGTYNIAIGYCTIQVGVVTGDDNIAIGRQALQVATSATGNITMGYQSAQQLTTGNVNIAIGYSAMHTGVVTGTNNIGIGQTALDILTSGTDNICIGNAAGDSLTTGVGNVVIGYQADTGAALTKTVALGYNAIVTASNTIALGGSGANACAVVINASAAVGTELLYVASGGIRGVGTTWLGCPAAAPADATLQASQVTFWVDEALNLLTFKVKYAGGTVKSGTAALA